MFFISVSFENLKWGGHVILKEKVNKPHPQPSLHTHNSFSKGYLYNTIYQL